MWLVFAQQQHQRELAFPHPPDGHERQPGARPPEHAVERAVAGEGVDQHRRVGAHLRCWEAALEHHLAAVERAHVEGDRPRVDAGDARTVGAQTSSLATAYTASVSSTWSLLSNSRRTQ